jgi:Ca2+-binding RTX toxin-like protein
VGVEVNGVARGDFAVSSFARILAYGMGGNDQITVQNGITKNAFLDGGDGNDTVVGGYGHDVVFGGAGADNVGGNRGRDMLFGGTGADSVSGGADSDLLIGGTTAHDADEVALRRIFLEWTSSRSYTQRVNNLRTGANGVPVLNASTVFNDNAVDRLAGGGSSDWFWANTPQDILTDRASSERVN